MSQYLTIRVKVVRNGYVMFLDDDYGSTDPAKVPIAATLNDVRNLMKKHLKPLTTEDAS